MPKPRLPLKPPPLPFMPPGLLTLPRMLPFFACLALAVLSVRLAMYDAEHGYDFSLFMQCLCVISNAWFAIRAAEGICSAFRRWGEIRRSYNELVKEMELIEMLHIEIVAAGNNPPEELERRLLELAERLDARIREAMDKSIKNLKSLR